MGRRTRARTGSRWAHQAPLLARLDDLEALQAWRDTVVDAARQQGGAGGCPLGSLSSELSGESPWAREALAADFGAWRDAIRDGLAVMQSNGVLDADADPDRLALALLTAVQGGLVLAQAQRSTEALEITLDIVIDDIRRRATSP